MAGVTKLTVPSQSGAVAIYRINFTVLKSSVSYLTDIALDGVSIAGFDSSVYTYNIVLPIGTTVMPVVSWAPGDVYHSINCTLGGLNGTTRIVVRAQDNSVSTYLLQLSVAQANNTTLTDLRVGGVTISGFDPEVTTYQYLLPRGTTVLPEVTYTAYDSFQTIRLTSGGVEGETRIVVRSQTGDM